MDPWTTVVTTAVCDKAGLCGDRQGGVPVILSTAEGGKMSGKDGGPTSWAADRMSSGLKDRPDSMPGLLNELTAAAPAQNCQRMVVLGSAKVGKTAIVRRFLSNCFDEKYTPTIEDFHRKVYRIRGESYRLDILDTSGNNPFPAMKRLSLLTGHSLTHYRYVRVLMIL